METPQIAILDGVRQHSATGFAREANRRAEFSQLSLFLCRHAGTSMTIQDSINDDELCILVEGSKRAEAEFLAQWLLASIGADDG
jgi:hypothetical protein